MPEYAHLKTYAECETELRGGLQLTRSQVGLLFDIGPNVKVEYVQTDVPLDRVTFCFSEQYTDDTPTLSQHSQGAPTMLEQPTDVELLSLLESAAANLRAKLTPEE